MVVQCASHSSATAANCAGVNPRIIVVQLAQDRRRQVGARHRSAQFDLERRGDLAQFGGKFAGLRFTSTPMPRMMYLRGPVRR